MQKETLKTKIMKAIKQQILKGEVFETFTNDGDEIRVFHHTRWGFDTFVLELNGEIIVSAKRFNTVSVKLNKLTN